MMEILRIQISIISASMFVFRLFVLGFVLFFNMAESQEPIRSIRVDLDYLYDKDPQQQSRNVDAFIERLGKLKATVVMLQTYVDHKALGFAKRSYFKNVCLPLKGQKRQGVGFDYSQVDDQHEPHSELYKIVVNKIREKYPHLEIFAWIPIIGFDVGRDDLLILSYNPETKEISRDPGKYKRLSFFNEDARKIIFQIYDDLLKTVKIDGIAFHDDGVMTDFEDASEWGIKAQVQQGFPVSIEEIRQNHDLFIKWSRWKMQSLNDFVREIMDYSRKIQPHLKFTRSLFAMPIINPDSMEWFAQDLPSFLEDYDFVALMAMPYMEKAENPDTWLQDLVVMVGKYKDGLAKTLFELQAVDWNDNTKIPTEKLVQQMSMLSQMGARNYGYYPDDLFCDHPREDIIGKAMGAR